MILVFGIAVLIAGIMAWAFVQALAEKPLVLYK